jgi:hypothetical protein
LSEIFAQFCQVCTINTSELKEITNNLTDLYYEELLNTKMIKYFYTLLDGGLQERDISLRLAFIDNYKNNSMRV